MSSSPSYVVSIKMRAYKIREIAEQLPYEEPAPNKIESSAGIIAELNERIKELELEVKILRQTVKDIAGR